jgi:hypothetical protein
MTEKQSIAMPVWSILILAMCLGLITACGNGETTPQLESGLYTKLLVGTPNGPLPVNRPLMVQSRVQDIDNGVSHAELYVIEIRPEDSEAVTTQDLLITSSVAPFDQLAFTASQTFVPQQAGDYLIKVRGYNQLGEWVDSEYLGFSVVNQP